MQRKRTAAQRKTASRLDFTEGSWINAPMSKKAQKGLEVIILCDADPDRPDYGGARFDTLSPLVWRGLSEGAPRLLDRLPEVRDTAGDAARVTWCVRADENIEQSEGSIDAGFRPFENLWRCASDMGHEIGWHPHHWRWNDERRCWRQETRDRDWMVRNLEKGFAALPVAPAVSRCGWGAMDNVTMNTLRRLGVRADCSAAPGMEQPGGPDRRGSDFLGRYDWSRARHAPFQPHERDYQAHAPVAGGLVEFPCTTVASPWLGRATSLRYRLRGAGARRSSPYALVNITAHPVLFAGTIRAALAEAERKGQALLTTSFHPDELTGRGPGRFGIPVYSTDHFMANLAALRRACDRGGVGLRFVTPSMILEDWSRRFARDAERSFACRPVAIDEIPRVAGLMTAVFPALTDRTDLAEHYRWKYGVWSERPPHNLGHFDERGELAGQYLTLSMKTRYFDREIVTAYSCDTAVRPDLQGRGLSGYLVRRQHDWLRDDGVDFVWGFPNSNFFPLWTGSLSWRKIADYPFLLAPVRADAVMGALVRRPGLGGLATAVGRAANLALRAQPTNGVELEWVKNDEAAEWVEEIWSDFKESFEIGVVRDSRYLRRRYLESPGVDYRVTIARHRGRPLGVFVTRRMPKRGLDTLAICEAIFFRHAFSRMRPALGALAEKARSEGVEAIGACCLPHRPEYRSYVLSGFAPVPVRMHPEKTHFAGCPLRDIDDVGPRIFEPLHWYISWGDLDTV